MIEIFDDIRRLYTFSAPCDELSAYIEFFSESSPAATRIHTHNKHFTVKMFPSWTPTFWFNLGRPYQLAMQDHIQWMRPGSDVLLIRNGIVERQNDPQDHLFSVKFYPGALEAVLGLDQSKMQNQVISLYNMLPPQLVAQVHQQNGLAGRQALLQQFFLQQLRKQKKRDHYIRFINETIACYTNGAMQYNVNELAAKLFTSSKTINRYFNQVIGINPKNYFSILRARTALTAYITQPLAFDPAIFGYYDSSHFYKEMIRFTGKQLAIQSA